MCCRRRFISSTLALHFEHQEALIGLKIGSFSVTFQVLRGPPKVLRPAFHLSLRLRNVAALHAGPRRWRPPPTPRCPAHVEAYRASRRASESDLKMAPSSKGWFGSLISCTRSPREAARSSSFQLFSWVQTSGRRHGEGVPKAIEDALGARTRWLGERGQRRGLRRLLEGFFGRSARDRPRFSCR